jgi:hypothetical protein
MLFIIQSQCLYCIRYWAQLHIDPVYSLGPWMLCCSSCATRGHKLPIVAGLTWVETALCGPCPLVQCLYIWGSSWQGVTSCSRDVRASGDPEMWVSTPPGMQNWKYDSLCKRSAGLSKSFDILGHVCSIQFMPVCVWFKSWWPLIITVLQRTVCVFDHPIRSHGGIVVGALCYNPKNRGFECQLGNWFFQFT